MRFSHSLLPLHIFGRWMFFLCWRWRYALPFDEMFGCDIVDDFWFYFRLSVALSEVDVQLLLIVLSKNDVRWREKESCVYILYSAILCDASRNQPYDTEYVKIIFWQMKNRLHRPDYSKYFMYDLYNWQFICCCLQDAPEYLGVCVCVLRREGGGEGANI